MGLESVDPVVIRFSVAGIPDAERAFRRISKAVNDVETTSATTSVQGADRRIRTTRREVDERVKIEEHFSRMKEKVADQQWKSASKAFDKELREHDKVTQQMVRQAERAAREEERIIRHKSDIIIREAKRSSDAWHKSIGGGLTSMIGGTGMIAGAVAGIGGGFAVADIMRGRVSAEKQAALLVNTVTTGNAPPAGANVKDILAQAAQVSIATGMSKEELVGGTLEYARKARGGDFAGAMANMSFFAKMATATGANMNDIAVAAGTLQSQNQDLSPQDMQQMLLNVYAQGKVGSMSMVDVAKQIGTLSSTRSSFGGDVARTQQVLMGLGQIAAPEGSVEEAGTYVKDLALEAGKHSDVLKHMGVKYDQMGRISSPENLIEQVFKGTGGDITKIEKIFGARGSAIFRGLMGDYSKGAATGGTSGGVAAVHDRLMEQTNATMSVESLNAQVGQMIEQPGKRIEMAFNKLREGAEDKLAPALESFASTLPRLIPYVEGAINAIDHFARFFADNPGLGIATVIGAGITKELASGLVAKAASTAIGASLASMTIPVSAMYITAEMVDFFSKKSAQEQGTAIGQATEASAIADRIRAGTASDADMKRAEELKGQLTKSYVDLNEKATPGAWDVAVDMATQATSWHKIAPENLPSAIKAAGISKEQEVITKSHAELIDALATHKTAQGDLTTAVKSLTGKIEGILSLSKHHRTSPANHTNGSITDRTKPPVI